MSEDYQTWMEKVRDLSEESKLVGDSNIGDFDPEYQWSQNMTPGQFIERAELTIIQSLREIDQTTLHNAL